MSRNGHRHSSSRRARRLSFEPLEGRRMLAVLGLDIQLLADDSGSPGAPISSPEQLSHGPVQVNDEFWVRVVAWDQRDPQNVPDPNVGGDETPGVISLPLNIAWDPTVLMLTSPLPAGTDIPNDPGNPVSQLVTSSFPLARELDSFSGAASATTCDGVENPGSCNLNNLQGAALPAIGAGQPIGTDGPEEFSLLRFRAIGAADQSPFLLQLAGSMSFEDAASLDGVAHLVDGQLNDADDENRVLEFLQVEAGPASATISGSVYADTDLDGVFDPHEIGLPNVLIQLFRDGMIDPFAEVTTGPDGWYHFEDLPAGVYTVREVQDPDFVNAFNTLGVVLPGNEQRGTLGDDAFLDIALADGDQAVDYNFGENLRNVNKRLFLASTRPRDVLCEHLGVSCVTVEGTAGNDNITFEIDGDTMLVTVNAQPPLEFSTTEVDIVTIDGGAGDDEVTLIGGPQDEVAHLTTRRTALSSPTYGVLTENAETVIADGRTGDDLAVFSDAPENEALSADGQQAELLAPVIDLLARARFFEQVRANSVLRDEADTDTLSIGSPQFLLLPFGKWVVV